MKWLARLLAPYILDELIDHIHDQDQEILRLEEHVKVAVDKAVTARHMVEELAAELGYEIDHDGVDTVILVKRGV